MASRRFEKRKAAAEALGLELKGQTWHELRTLLGKAPKDAQTRFSKAVGRNTGSDPEPGHPQSPARTSQRGQASAKGKGKGKAKGKVKGKVKAVAGSDEAVIKALARQAAAVNGKTAKAAA
jgi:hypothetical protein